MELQTDRIMRRPAVLAATGWSGTTLWRRVVDEEFPAPVDIGNGRVGWLASEVQAWIESRPRVKWEEGSGKAVGQ